MLVIKGQICLAWQRSLFTSCLYCLYFIPCVRDFPVLLKLREDAQELSTGCGTQHRVAICSALFNLKLLWAPLCLQTAWSHMVLLRLCAGQGPWPSLQLGQSMDLLLDWVPSESQEKLDLLIAGLCWASWRCFWLCEPGRSGYQRKGGPHPVLSACRDLHPGGRREPSPQSSRVLLSNPPAWAVSSFTLEQMQVPCPWLTFQSSADTQGCTLGRLSCWEQVALGFSPWSQGLFNPATWQQVRKWH